ncbi:hypothetical protein ATZ36_02270 [Candidatus Endomicrobiellum trichonymphae]|uniref:Uncharacterized protein n=1 Tax=Endomicrobium trichonymphae TaxID=1408204 RepID=A0A1E5IGU9_ENDTX|nr:hypothetical protein ATZ36_02270 [Candidatus Endomicrobium trichonymphae]
MWRVPPFLCRKFIIAVPYYISAFCRFVFQRSLYKIRKKDPAGDAGKYLSGVFFLDLERKSGKKAGYKLQGQ